MRRDRRFKPWWAANRPRRRQASAAGILVETFVLAARRDALQDLCDEWLNAYAPSEVAIFRPSVPFVFCSKLYYPEMGDRFAWDTGTQSQTELYFAVPVERWQHRRGGDHFVEHGIVTPFIYVDNPASAVGGREVFGFPKELATFGRTWDPSARSERQQSWNVCSWEPTSTGVVLRPFLRAVGTSQDPSWKQALPSTESTEFLWSARQLWGELLSHWERVGLGGAGYPLSSLFSLVRGGIEVNVFNFRQFPDPEYEEAARYQDIVKFRMRVNHVRDFGRMGPHQLLVNRSELRPIARQLGLKTTSVLREDSAAMDVVDALVPTFADVDVDLVWTERLCWRMKTGDWKLDDGRQIDPPTDDIPRWCTTLGRSVGAAFMAEHTGENTLDAKIMLLPADLERTTQYLEQAIPDGFPGTIRPIAANGRAAVRLLNSRSRERDARNAEELVWLDGHYLSLTVPVEVELNGSCFRALFLLADFTSNGFMLHALRELALSPTYMASFVLQDSGWFASTQPSVHSLRMRSQALDRTADAARVEERPILDVWTTAAPSPRAPDPDMDEIWEFARQLQAIVSCGVVSGPSITAEPVARRVMLTEIEDYRVTPSAGCNGSVDHVVLLHATETFPFFEELGFPELEAGSDLLGTRSGSATGRVRAVLAHRFTEVALDVVINRMTVLWEDTGDTDGRR